MTLQEMIRRYGIEYLSRFYSSHRALVLKNVDPNKAERLYVLIPDIADGVRAWAYAKGISGGPNVGMKYLTPKVGDVVWVEFERGDPMRPVWSYHGWAAQQMPDELSGPGVCGIVTPKGNKVYLKETEGVLNIELQQGVELIINNGTRVSIQGDQTIINGGNNRGLVNIAQIESLVKALLKDLITAQSGSNLSSWMGSEMPQMEDKKITH